MMTFDAIATALLKEQGYEVLECASDTEAIERAAELHNGSKYYPVHYSKSDTSGEKAFEEFYTDGETVDMDRFSDCGSITGKELFDSTKVNMLFTDLEEAFAKEDVSKEHVVSILKEFLPNFEHIETGKSLDEKM